MIYKFENLTIKTIYFVNIEFVFLKKKQAPHGWSKLGDSQTEFWVLQYSQVNRSKITVLYFYAKSRTLLSGIPIRFSRKSKNNS